MDVEGDQFSIHRTFWISWMQNKTHAILAYLKRWSTISHEKKIKKTNYCRIQNNFFFHNLTPLHLREHSHRQTQCLHCFPWLFVYKLVWFCLNIVIFRNRKHHRELYPRILLKICSTKFVTHKLCNRHLVAQVGPRTQRHLCAKATSRVRGDSFMVFLQISGSHS